jgi:activator of 2-hydroxyglutaryl-CoA dehydratase
MLSGGVVQNPLIAVMFAEELNTEITLPNYPQFMGALGAALIALGR